MINRRNVFLSAILFLSIFLRMEGLFCGLPSSTGRLSTFHFDEYMTFESLGNMKPASFDFYPGITLCWGSFQVYAEGAVLKIMQLAGIFNPLSKDELKKNLRQADRMYISGRIMTGLFSLASVILIFVLARRFFGEKSALWTAAFLAFSYVEVYISSIVKPDSIMLFWGILSFYFLLFWQESARKKHLMLAAVFNGLSFASKYTGLIFFLNFAVLSFFLLRREGIKKTLVNFILYGFLMTAVFLIVNPYFIIRPADSFSYFWAMFSKTSASGSLLAGYREYFLEIMPVSYGLPILIFFTASAIWALKSSRKLLHVPLFFCAFYIVKFGYPLNQAFTYSLPMAPFIALVCGVAAGEINKKWIYLAAFLTLLYSFSYCLWQKSLWTSENTVSKVSRYIEKNINTNSVFCISRMDIWTPVILRKYDTPYRLSIAGGPKTLFDEGLRMMLSNTSGCGYAVISEYENRIIASDLSLSALKKDMQEKFDRVYEIKRPENRLFVLSNSHHYLFASFMNPGFELFVKRGKNGSKRDSSLLQRN